MDEAARYKYDEERFDHHSEVRTIHTPLIDRLSKDIQLLLISNRRQVGARQGLLVSGEPTTGKTTALLAVGAAAEHRIRARTPGAGGAPVAYISLPPQASPKNIALAVIRFFGVHPPDRTPFPELMHSAAGLLSGNRTRLLIIDEVHNLSLRNRAGAEASDFLKHLAECTEATPLYGGIDLQRHGLFDDARGRQIAGRFALVRAAPFAYSNEADRTLWTNLVGAFESHLLLFNHRKGTLTRANRYLFTRTGGHIGSLANLIRKAAIAAMLDGTERIDKERLEATSTDWAAESSTATRIRLVR